MYILNTKIKNEIEESNKKDKKECKSLLKEVLPKIFKAFKKAKELYDNEISLTPFYARTERHDANTFNVKMIQALYSIFPENIIDVKYGRKALRINGYIIFIKKLDAHDMPMNIPTKISEQLKHQNLGELFPEDDNGRETILFFGYKKDNFGDFVNPRLVYIDGNHRMWSIIENEIYESGDNEIPLRQEDKTDSDPKVSVKKERARVVK
jgi:hypothetical protein